jgi:sec-independent protein translocase protein TatB
MLLALVVFGPRRLPEIGRQIGKLMYEFRKVSNDFKYQMEEELRASEEAERLKKLQALQAATPAPVPAPIPALPSETTPVASPEASIATEPSVSGEVRGSYPQIQPPSTGEPIAAQRPFRGHHSEATELPSTESAISAESESGQEAHHG